MDHVNMDAGGDSGQWHHTYRDGACIMRRGVGVAG